MSGVSTRVKDQLRRLGHRSGLLPALHRTRNRDTLTVLGLHRVLPENDPAWEQAMPEFSVTTAFFRDVLDFARTHYHIVDMDAVLEAHDGGTPLPPRALAVTFDDGWLDNLVHAAPVARQLGVPATVFVTPAATLGERSFWREELFAAHRSLPGPDFEGAWMEVFDTPLAAGGDGYGAVAEAEQLEPRARLELVQALERRAGRTLRAALAGGDELRQMSEWFAIGGHGFQHEWLTALPDVEVELERCRTTLEELLAGTDHGTPRTLSFPHGRYDAAVVAACRSAGFRLLFTSDQCLNSVAEGRPRSDVLARMFVTMGQMGRQGRFQADRAANVLFRAPIDTLDESGPRHF